MAKTVVITDDIDGSAGAETVTFSYQNKTYELDLGKKSQAAMEKVLKPYLDAARVTSSPRAKRGGSAGRKSSPSELASIREWATANGYEVSSRGRISGAVVEAYEAAH